MGEAPLAMPVLLFAVLAILFITSTVQLSLTVPAFIISSFGAISEVIGKEGAEQELYLLFSSYSEGDLSLLINLFSSAAALVLSIVFCRVIAHRRLDAIGLVKERAGGRYALGIALGALLFSLSAGVCLLNGSLTWSGLSKSVNPLMLLPILLGYIVQGAAEEFLYRGVLMTELARRGSPLKAVLLSSFIFSFAHAVNYQVNTLALVNTFLFGILASILLLRTGSLLGACAMHTAWNFVQGHIFGCNVSGTVTSTTLFATEIHPGKTLTNGGGFGPEGGAAVTVVLLLAVVCLLLIPERKRNESYHGRQ